ncbi:TIGR02281 family clan AA aspartic protease [Novosphingobium piscinae]|uniref:TIGR02281 family clan AA aspartic protease n=1 Tax=Novosphingobium piscinae TaxID=1507448 RepID=A0A7X1FZ91_9SPHN|nr:TIGR02281 family clan AA aspartic protease [Novosphingobium piscinae]MBC2669725.1 TIGR02281 family clan AA aspartic protease [Novosphingobium piscinae]
MKQLGVILVGFATIALAFGGSRSPDGPPAAPGAAPVPAITPSAPAARRASFAGESLVIPRDASGQFHVDLVVNGAPARFLVDTGADVVALTEADAERAGLVVDPASYRPILRTASGEGYGAPARLDRLAIGQVELRDVTAVVVKDLGTSLLGQSALARLGRVELSGDRLVLEPRS